MKIEISDLTFTYGEHAVLRGATFSVPTGSFLGIIGPNGSGKTTMLKLMSRLLKPKGGCILLGERALEEFGHKELARTMAVVAQDTTAAYQFTVEDIVLMGRAPYIGRFQSETTEDYDCSPCFGNHWLYTSAPPCRYRIKRRRKTTSHDCRLWRRNRRFYCWMSPHLTWILATSRKYLIW